MSPVLVNILIGLALILGGLAMRRWCDSAGPSLSGVVRVAGTVLLILGLLIVFSPVLAWVYRQLVEAFGLQGGRV